MVAVLKFLRVLRPQWLGFVGLILLLGGCASRGSPVVSDHSPVFGPHPSSYQVRAGDTLYSIAWRYGFDVVELAGMNKIQQPFTIYPKQRLLLRRPPPITTRPPQAPAVVRSRPPIADVKEESDNWAWPVKSTPLLRYGERGGGGISNGFYYELPSRTPIRAAAAGKVVYAGPGLGGYERLIILDHGQSLLSAYGFHGQARVREQQHIKVGAQLADTLGSSAEFSRFHFEVRKHGQPIDPKRLNLR